MTIFQFLTTPRFWPQQRLHRGWVKTFWPDMMQLSLNITHMKFKVFLWWSMAHYRETYGHFESTFAPCSVSFFFQEIDAGFMHVFGCTPPVSTKRINILFGFDRVGLLAKKIYWKSWSLNYVFEGGYLKTIFRSRVLKGGILSVMSW